LTVQRATSSVASVSPEEAEQMLAEWVRVTQDRDNRIRAAVAGMSKHRVYLLTGISRTTIDRILAASEPGGTINWAIREPG